MVKLENITQSDYNDIAKLTSLHNVMKYIGNGKTYSSKKVKQFIKYCEIENKQSDKIRTNYYYKIVDNKKFIGIIGFHKMKSKNYYRTTYIHPKHQGKGYFTKSNLLLFNKIKKHKPHLKFIISMVHKNNKKMNIIQNKKGIYINTINYSGKLVNQYKINIPEYKKSKKSKITNITNNKSKKIKRQSSKKKSYKQSSNKAKRY